MGTEITAEVVALSMVAHLGKHKYKYKAYLTSGYISPISNKRFNHFTPFDSQVLSRAD